MRLVALADISDSIGTIRKGSVFVCNNRMYRENLIACKQAVPEHGRSWGEENGLDWRGLTAVILASGPSLTEHQCEIVKTARFMRPLRVIAINTTYQRAPWADILYACDLPWWVEYHDKAKSEFRGQFWTQDENAAKKYGLRYIRSVNSPGLSKQAGTIHQGGNGGYQAIGLAVQAGAKRIVLLGYDMHARGGKHWHGDHPKSLNKRLPFADWIKRYEVLAADLSAAGVEIVNCSPDSVLACFQKGSIETAL